MAQPYQTKTEQPKLVDGTRLLELVFDSKSRPSRKWLRHQTQAGKIPAVTLGRLVFYDVATVRKAVSL